MTTSTLDKSAAGQRQEPEDLIGPSRAHAWLLLITGGIGLLSAFMLTLDKIKLLEDPNFVPNCNINPIISCGSVMNTDQASLLGFPNSILGLPGYAAVMCIGVAVLAGARFQRWFWVCTWLGTVAGVGFLHWLLFESLYSIGILCPYCLLDMVGTIPLFFYTTMYCLKQGVLPLSPRGRRTLNTVQEFHWVFPVTWYLVLALLILIRFWSYWKTLV